MNYHFIGIGGISMSGIARYLKALGHQVSGCDFVSSKMTDELIKEGIPVEIGHNPDHVQKDLDRVVYNIRVPSGPGNVEIEKAKEIGVETIDRLKLISELAENKISIAIAGMHGKTTTTAMTGLIFLKAGKDPDILLGGNCSLIGGNVKVGQGKHFIYEACEYDPAFIELKPNFGIITNIEKEHLDRFKNMEDILATFTSFVKNIDSEGFLVVYGDDKNIRKVIKEAKCKVITFGRKENNEFIIKNIQKSPNQIDFEIVGQNLSFQEKLIVPGMHNILDASAASILCLKMGIDLDIIKKTLSNFEGVDRRIEIKYRAKDVIIIDDYAHNPTEIKSSLSAISEFYPDKKLTVIFRPSQYSRNEAFIKEYGKCFGPADKLIILKTAVPPGKEAEPQNITSEDLVAEIKKSNLDVQYLLGFEEVKDYFNKKKPAGVVVTMGLGNVYELASELVRLVKSQ